MTRRKWLLLAVVVALGGYLAWWFFIRDARPSPLVLTNAAVTGHVGSLQFDSTLPAAEVEAVDCGAASVRLRIEPRADIQGFDPRSLQDLPPSSARVLARIINVDSVSCDLFNMGPRDVKYWWVRKEANGGIINIYAGGDSASFAQYDAYSREFFVHPYDSVDNPRPPGPRARWNDRTATTRREVELQVAGVILIAESTRSWGGCPQGCCQSGPVTAVDQF